MRAWRPTLAGTVAMVVVIGVLAVAAAQTFGIDYAHPNSHLVQGEQTRISNPSVLDPLRGMTTGLTQLGAIYKWLRTFDVYGAGGETIGKATVDGLLASRRLGGCHDFALVYAAAARELGYPAIMVDTANADWIKHFRAGEQGPHAGHVFVEVFLTDHWILVDSTSGAYVSGGYDPANPVFCEPPAGRGPSTAFYVMWKGTDTVAYGIHSNAEMILAMDSFAKRTDPSSIWCPGYTWRWFSP